MYTPLIVITTDRALLDTCVEHCESYEENIVRATQRALWDICVEYCESYV